jgi:hypothetical protein
LPRVEDEVRAATTGWRARVLVSSMAEPTPAATKAGTKVDRGAKHHVELEGLPPAVRHLVPVIPDPVDDTLISVGIGWDRLAWPGVGVQRRQRHPKPIALRQPPADRGSGSVLHGKAKAARLVHQLGQHLDRADEVEEELLDQLLAVMGIGAGEVPAVERE